MQHHYPLSDADGEPVFEIINTTSIYSTCQKFTVDCKPLAPEQFDLSPYSFEIPNDVSRLFSQILFGCLLLSQEYCKLIGWFGK